MRCIARVGRVGQIRWNWRRCVLIIFFFQAEDGIRDAQESRGLGDVYKRQVCLDEKVTHVQPLENGRLENGLIELRSERGDVHLSLIHI